MKLADDRRRAGRGLICPGLRDVEAVVGSFPAGAAESCPTGAYSEACLLSMNVRAEKAQRRAAGGGAGTAVDRRPGGKPGGHQEWVG